MRRHITRKSLAKLARELQTLTPEEQERYYGGGDGSVASPYTYKEYQLMSSSGTFLGGYVDVGGGESIFYAASKALDGGVASGDRVLDEVHVNASSGAVRDVFRDIFEDHFRYSIRDGRMIYGGDWIYDNDGSGFYGEGSGYYGVVPQAGVEGVNQSSSGGGGGGSGGSQSVYYKGLDKPATQWITQAPNGCYDACVAILKRCGVTSAGPDSRMIASDQRGMHLTVNAGMHSATAYIRSEIDAGRPVIIGVDDTLRSSGKNHHKGTDHFVVVVGYGTDGQKGQYFQYLEVGTKHHHKAISKENRLFLGAGDLWQRKGAMGEEGRTYTITEVRRNVVR